MHKCWPLFISFLLILLFTSRTIYDLVAVRVEDAKKFGFGWRWTFATDMVRGCLEGSIYVQWNLATAMVCMVCMYILAEIRSCCKWESDCFVE